MNITPALARLTMERADTSTLKHQAMLDGMTPLVADGARKVLQGLTTIDEVLAVAIIEHTEA
jgi:type II secretory ATPase GspE/PulE/Tfp pilus assembly ATPase PilB-like protein